MHIYQEGKQLVIADGKGCVDRAVGSQFIACAHESYAANGHK